MADTKKTKNSKTASTKTAPKKGGSAPGGKKSTQKSGMGGRDNTVDREAKAARRRTFSEQFLPYILGAISLFLVVCFVTDAFSGNAAPADHKMGYVGYYICYALFGLLGWVAYLIPAVMIVMTVFWKRYCRDEAAISRTVLSGVLLLLLAAVTHVFICHGDAHMAGTYHPGELFTAGTAFKSGGVIGGLIGYLLYLALRLPGTIVLAVITVPLIVMCLLGVTPMYVIGKIMDTVRAQREKDDEDEYDYDEDEVYEEKKPRRTRQYKEYKGYDGQDARENEDEDQEDETDRRPAKRRSPRRDADRTDRDDTSNQPEQNRRYMRLDPDTGEVLDEPDDVEDENDESTNRKGASLRSRKSKSPRDDRYDHREEKEPSLPLFDHSNEPQERRETPTSTVEAVATTAAKAPQTATGQDDLPWDDTPVSDAPSVEDTYSEELDAMAVGFDDDLAEDGTSDVMGTSEDEQRRVRYEVVNESGEAAMGSPAGGPSREPVTVRILKSETGAVDERGLAEEELVLPSGTRASDTPAEPAEEEVPVREYVFPSSDLLARGSSHYETNEEEIAENTEILREVLESFHIRVREISCSCGPTITRFEVKPDTGVRVRSIANLVDDIAMGLAKAGVRIEAPIPGKSAVGIEVPNAEPATVYLRNILDAPEFRNHKSRIAACLGADVSGRPVILDINKMPHLLIAGATGTGKSVCINSLIMSILYKAKPDEVKLILIDPKKVEFAMYRDLPHLYAPVVSDPKKAAGALNSAVNEMERRFELIEEVGVRNLAGYNEVTADDPERPPLPQMVIIIDELADLMMTAPAEVETAICRLAQKARAAGIHLVIGTQRPSVDVITGLIKANVPSRIAFTVKSGVDSRTILDTVGADKLIGRGDMLYAPIGSSKPIRVQGAFVSESEVERVVSFIKDNNDGPVYNEEFSHNMDIEAAKCGVGKKKADQMSIDDFDGLGGSKDGEDPKFWEALEVVVTKEKIGTSALQRALQLGYGRAAKIIDRMEELGFVSPDPGTKQGRKVYITKQNLMEYKLNGLPGSRDDSTADGNDDGGEGDL